MPPSYKTISRDERCPIKLKESLLHLFIIHHHDGGLLSDIFIVIILLPESFAIINRGSHLRLYCSYCHHFVLYAQKGVHMQHMSRRGYRLPIWLPGIHHFFHHAL